MATTDIKILYRLGELGRSTRYIAYGRACSLRVERVPAA